MWTSTRLLFASMLAAAVSSAAWAAPVSTSDIVCGLDPHCTRPLSREFRGVTVTPGPVGTDPLSVNLYVNFAYDSAELTSDARIILDRLGYALVDDRLKEFSFMIEGHTDAHGSAPYNQTLSEQRARTVQRYLIDNFGIAEARLRAQGFGKTRLLDPTHPEDGVNRRVQVVNLTAGTARQQSGK
jgi:outer membrane protein OmpA-like peptidoglycan-associated protein